ncbi:hypothetical protein [Dialister sp.]|jgi:hypothetical protein|uniref:hypothetical protein n=1 Tax=Dialister sp. TaxID=1955814 RepID=UPI003A5C6071
MDKLIEKAKALGIEVTISDFDDLRRQYCFTWKDRTVYVVLSNEKKLPARLKLEAESCDGEFKEKLMELVSEME